MKRLIIAFAGLLLLGLTACSFVNRDGNDSTPTPVVVSEEAIAEVLVRFSEAFVNNNQGSLKDFWSRRSCDSKAVAYIELASEVTDENYRGTYQLEVNSDLLVILEGDDQVTVPINQLDGAMSATLKVEDQEEPVPLTQPLPFEADIQFSYDEGWKVTNCRDLFINELEDETPSAKS